MPPPSSSNIDTLGQRLHHAVVTASEIMAETQKQIAAAAEKTQAESLKIQQTLNSESLKIQRKLAWLTVVLALAGFSQAIAAGWPYISWFLAQYGVKFP
jgi:hypothetical protein